MQGQNRNVRITYPDSPNGELEIDVVQGIEMSLNLTYAELEYYAKDGVLKILQNLWANPGYRHFLFSKTAVVTLNNESPPGNNDDDPGNNDDDRVDLIDGNLIEGKIEITYRRAHR